MAIEQERKRIETPKEVWETTDGVRLKGGPLGGSSSRVVSRGRHSV